MSWNGSKEERTHKLSSSAVIIQSKEEKRGAAVIMSSTIRRKELVLKQAGRQDGRVSLGFFTLIPFLFF